MHGRCGSCPCLNQRASTTDTCGCANGIALATEIGTRATGLIQWVIANKGREVITGVGIGIYGADGRFGVGLNLVGSANLIPDPHFINGSTEGICCIFPANQQVICRSVVDRIGECFYSYAIDIDRGSIENPRVKAQGNVVPMIIIERDPSANLQARLPIISNKIVTI